MRPHLCLPFAGFDVQLFFPCVLWFHSTFVPRSGESTSPQSLDSDPEGSSSPGVLTAAGEDNELINNHDKVTEQDLSLFSQHYMDGALSNNMPLFEQRNTITMCPFSGESDICPKEGTFNFLEVYYGNVSIQVNTSNVHRVCTAFLPPRLEVGHHQGASIQKV